jgi:hypothetical protein
VGLICNKTITKQLGLEDKVISNEKEAAKFTSDLVNVFIMLGMEEKLGETKRKKRAQVRESLLGEQYLRRLRKKEERDNYF